MSQEKRFAIFLLLLLVWLYTFPYVLDLLGFKSPAKQGAQQDKHVAGKDLPKATAAELKAIDLADKAKEKDKDKPAKPPTAPQGPKVELVPFSELVLGDATDKTPNGYRLQVQLEQKGAGVESVSSSRFDAEFKDGNFKKRPLQLLEPDRLWPASLSMTLSQKSEKAKEPAADDEELIDAEAVEQAEDSLDRELWEVVRDDQNKVVRQITKEDTATKAKINGQAVVFRTTAADGLVVTKTFRLWTNSDDFEVELAFESPGQPRTVVYNLMGPHGIPIEGEWYTSTFREVFFGQQGPNSIEIPTYTAADVAAATKPIDNTALPLRFAGIENQYFAALVEPYPAPKGQEDRWDDSAVALYHAPRDPKDKAATQKGAVAVKIKSRPIKLAADQKAVHTYRVFAGTKSTEALAPFGAEGLASYRKSSWIPFAPYLARVFITPTLSFTYEVTRRVAALFGGTKGNYGIAIILLTFLVRLILFPLGRKQALSAQKMQELQPYLKEIQIKYKDDKERLTKETFAVYKKHGFNPFGGCVPALVQLPIFVGLWQALNTSVVLRHASFLWIRDLSAPDMLFQFPGGTEVPFLGHWFNILPLVVVSLMLVQTKLFSPPPTTPEAEMNQKMMKYMMAFMAVMFYKVPAGLGIYFITSSLWSIGERLLIPKLQKKKADADPDSLGDGDGKSPRGGKGGPSPEPPTKPPGRFAQFWEKVMDEARNDPTYRKVLESTDPNRKDGDKSKDQDRNKDRGRPRSRPGKR